MAIPERVYEQFDEEVRRRGDKYFRRGAVRLVTIEDDLITAQVQGTRRYRVEIKWQDADDEFIARCTCPYAQEWDDGCKHEWATLRAADPPGFFGEADSNEQDGASSADREMVAVHAAKAPAWKRALARLRDDYKRLPLDQPAASFLLPADRRIVYLIDVAATREGAGGVTLELATQRRRRDGWERARAFAYPQEAWIASPDESDRLIAQMLLGARSHGGYYHGSSVERRFQLQSGAYNTTLKAICDTGRCALKDAGDTLRPLKWEEAAWQFVLELAPSHEGERIELKGSLRRGEQIIPLDQPKALTADGLLVLDDSLSRYEHNGAWPIVQALRTGAAIHAAGAQLDDMIAEVAKLPRLPTLQLDASIDLQVVQERPRPMLLIRKPATRFDERLRGSLSFDYGGRVIAAASSAGAIFDPPTRRLVTRDPRGEAEAHARLLSAGFKSEWQYDGPRLVLSPKKLNDVVVRLSAEGWQVRAEGALYRSAGKISIQVSSGIDWFELDGSIDFDGKLVTLPKLLAAITKGQNSIVLDDGSIGLLPTDWLAKYAPLVATGDAHEDVLRFSKAQVGLLDALLASMPEARIDETFALARQQMRSFDEIKPVDASDGFVGELRPYQRDGLGWLNFLERFGFGGCLADDMGLGKTIQVLALLEARRNAKPGPSLVVVPRSLVFNWKSEAAKFTPALRVLDHTGINRATGSDHFSGYDLVITTYGTLRRDAMYFKDFIFDYVILDEAQTIKNASTEAAKAARLLQGRHRLALSGTPIENRLAELWSLCEFLNPGMLGAASTFRNLIGNGEDPESRQLLSRALRPFILRRTKAQVARDLPEKLEQTIHCDLDPRQRKLYDELRVHYRQVLLSKIEQVGLNRSKIQVLEALLRLRQAACHPALLDKEQIDEPSAKLETLLEDLREVLSEGHKALVFSQFTSFLAIVRKRLDAQGTAYEYLDGKTRDRQAKVDRFQNDESCRLFLISLKAGGLGLNLTAADYVFLLDPWWNPAVEAQAIDRTHRIGQTRRVFAYRLIARDTVEEKVLQLQQTKRELADAIITADNSLISSLKREDLELLLS